MSTDDNSGFSPFLSRIGPSARRAEGDANGPADRSDPESPVGCAEDIAAVSLSGASVPDCDSNLKLPEEHTDVADAELRLGVSGFRGQDQVHRQGTRAEASMIEGPERTDVRRSSGTPWRNLLSNSTVQLALLCVIALVLTAAYGSFSADVTHQTGERHRPTFPKIKLEGAPPVTNMDVKRILAPLKSSGPRNTVPGEADSANDVPSRVGAIKLTPGVMIDPDAEDVKALAREFEEAQRRHRSTGQSRRPRSGESPRSGRGAGRAPTNAQGPAFYRPGGVLSPGGPQQFANARANDVSLSPGDRLVVRLEVGASSLAKKTVLARTVKAISRRGRVIVPRGAIIKGRASSDQERLQIEFSQAIAPTGARTRFRGYAVEGKMPGLIAQKREATFEERQSAGVARGALGVVRDVAGAVTNLPGRALQRVADETVPEAQREVTPKQLYVLEVAAGRKFEIVITEAHEGATK